MKMFLHSFDGTKIYYEITKNNSKQALVFLHGLGGDAKAWDTERQAFEKLGYTTLAVDLRGHGLSDRPTTENAYMMDHFARDIALIIQKEKLEHVVIVGHCFGGMVAMSLEYLYPDHIDALILVDTSYKHPYFSNLIADNNMLMYFLGLLGKYSPETHIHEHVNHTEFIGTSDFDPKRIMSDIAHMSLKSYLLISQELLHFDGRKLLDSIHIPTLVIEGTNDAVFPPDIAQTLHDRIKTSEIDFIHGANHIIVFNNPKELVENIKEFVEKLH